MRARLAVAAALASLAGLACGPKPLPPPIPTLPGDGDANVAKPPPAPTKPKVDDPWAGKTDLVVAPAAKPPARLELPAIDSFKLANGLQVFVIKSARLPTASVQLAIKAGRSAEPRARLGVAEATADTIVKGTKKHDAVGLARAIDFVGGTIAADATFEATLLSCSTLARDLPTCLDLLPEIVTQPTFPDDELAKVKDQMIGTVRGRLDDAGALASQHVQNLLWGDQHVRGWINSEQSVGALRRDDLLAWHKTWYVPNNAMLVVSGDVDAKKLRGELERAFGGWKKSNVPPTPSYAEPGLSGIRIRLVDKPGQTQTHIRVAQLGIKHDDPRFFDSLVWNYALGGGAFSSRLMRVVRVEGGKTYGASSSFDRNLDRGSFVAQTFTRNSEAVATTKLLVAEIAKMHDGGPKDDEVRAAVANLAGSYGLRFQTASDIGAALVGAELHGFGVEYLTNFPLAVGKVDSASAKQAAAEILDPKNYVIVLVGDAKDVEPQLKKEGWRFEKIAYTEPVTPDVKQPEAPVDPKAVVAARKVIDEALAAKGGKARLAAVKAFRLVQTGKAPINGQMMAVTADRVVIVPDQLRIEATIKAPQGDLKITYVIDAKGGWSQLPTGQVRDMTAADKTNADFELWRDPELILLKAAAANAKLVPMPDETIDGKPQAVVGLVAPLGNVTVSIYIDRKTKLITRLAYAEQGHRQVEDYSDYQDEKGIKIARKRGSAQATLDVTKVEIDPKIDPALFKKP